MRRKRVMKKYDELEIELIHLEIHDVITSSPGKDPDENTPSTPPISM